MSSSTQFESLFSMPIATMEYRDMAGHPISDATGKPGARAGNGAGKRRVVVDITEEELATKIQSEVAEATRRTEQRLRQEYEQKLLAARAPIPAAIDAFTVQRTEYYARVEAEIVQLALAIAAKILHRTVEKMREGSSVTVRVGPGRSGQWKDYLAGQPGASQIEVVEDTDLSDSDCLLETELGVANFGLDMQLKEIERGFFDLLALRPVS